MYRTWIAITVLAAAAACAAPAGAEDLGAAGAEASVGLDGADVSARAGDISASGSVSTMERSVESSLSSGSFEGGINSRDGRTEASASAGTASVEASVGGSSGRDADGGAGNGSGSSAGAGSAAGASGDAGGGSSGGRSETGRSGVALAPASSGRERSRSLPASLVPRLSCGDSDNPGCFPAVPDGRAGMSAQFRRALAQLGRAPQATIAACRNGIIRGATPYSPVRVDAVSIGDVRQVRGGGQLAPLFVRIIYDRQGGYETREAQVSCQLDANGRVVALS